MNNREVFWFKRGVQDAFIGLPLLQFEDPPVGWSEGDVIEARDAYNTGVAQCESNAAL